MWVWIKLLFRYIDDYGHQMAMSYILSPLYSRVIFRGNSILLSVYKYYPPLWSAIVVEPFPVMCNLCFSAAFVNKGMTIQQYEFTVSLKQACWNPINKPEREAYICGLSFICWLGTKSILPLWRHMKGFFWATVYFFLHAFTEVCSYWS